jgi:WD40 repeat protein
VQFNPANESYFVSSSIDGKVRVWSVSNCHVIDWVDVKEIATAVCYRPDGKVILFLWQSMLVSVCAVYMKKNLCYFFFQEVVVGTINGNCRFYDSTGKI